MIAGRVARARSGPAVGIMLAGTLVLTISCGSSPSPSLGASRAQGRPNRAAPPPQPAAPAFAREYVTLTGDEQIGWDQQLPPGASPASVRYYLYVDRVPTKLDATCQAANGPALSCQSRLPKVTRGRHRFELTASIPDSRGVYVESFRSPPMDVFVGPVPSASAAATMPPGGASCAVAMAGDKVFAADAAGIWRARTGRAEPVPAIPVQAPGSAVIALAADPAFHDNGYLYALIASTAEKGARLSLVRYRDQGAALADRVVLLDGPTDARYTHGRVRFGEQGRLYIGAWVPAGAPPPSPLGGIVLRLGQDGKVPADSPDRTGVILRSEGLTAFDLDPEERPWVIEQTAPGRYTARALGAANQRLSAPLPLDAPPSRLAIGGGTGSNIQFWVTFDEHPPVQIKRSGRGVSLEPAGGAPTDIAGDLGFAGSGLVGCGADAGSKSGPRVFEVRPAPGTGAVSRF